MADVAAGAGAAGAGRPERSRVELYGAGACPYTSELREHLVWNRVTFTEFDVEADAAARERLLVLTGGRSAVPVLVEDGRVTEIGWRGRSCAISVNG